MWEDLEGRRSMRNKHHIRRGGSDRSSQSRGFVQVTGPLTSQRRRGRKPWNMKSSDLLPEIEPMLLIGRMTQKRLCKESTSGLGSGQLGSHLVIPRKELRWLMITLQGKLMAKGAEGQWQNRGNMQRSKQKGEELVEKTEEMVKTTGYCNS